jgi:aminocarboxymuconate-semialdehyde decarboxylase
MIFGGVFERLPGLRVAFAHGGGAFGALAGRIDHGFRVRPDLCATASTIAPRDHLGRFYVDSLVHEASFLKHLLGILGAERIALGTDYPFPLGEAIPGRLIEELPGVTESVRERLLGGTALEFLGLERARFKG